MRKLLFTFLAVLGLASAGHAQYCAAPHSNTCSSTNLSNLVDTLYSNTGFAPLTPTCQGSSTYHQLRNAVLNVVEGSPFDLNVKVHGTGNWDASLWVDLNRDQAFQASEWFDLGRTVSLNPTRSISLTMPVGSAGATTGARLRIRASASGNAATDMCTSFASGSTYDFEMNITQAVACTGTPAAPVIPTTLPALCITESATVANSTFYSNSGIQYLWQISTDAGSTWNPAPGTNNTQSYSINGAVVANGSQLRLQVTCANGGAASVSNTLTVSIKPSYACMCPALHNSTCSNGVLLTALRSNTGWLPTLPTACAAGNVNQYDLTSGPRLDVTQGVTDSIIGAMGSAVSVSLFIDYNQNGVYEANEFTDITRQPTAARPFRNAFTIPANARIGLTAGRIRTRAANDNTDACASFLSGNSYDFVVNVRAGTPCATVSAAVITSDSTRMCGNNSSRLGATSITTGVGIGNYWQYSTDGGTTWNRAGGNDSTATYPFSGGLLGANGAQIRMITICSFSGNTAVSNVVSIAARTAAECFCTPSNSTCTQANIISSFSSASQGFNLTLPTSCGTSTATSYFSISGTRADTLFLNPGRPAQIEFRNGAAAMMGSFWIDFNNDGSFSPLTEFVNIGRAIPANAQVYATVNVPTTATLGITRARLRTRLTGNINDSTSSCLAMFSGHTYDFPVVIQTALSQDPQILAQQVRLYPNPSTGLVNLFIPEQMESGTVRILDMAGKDVTPVQALQPGSQTLALNLQAGLYTVVINHSAGRVTRKLVVQ